MNNDRLTDRHLVLVPEPQNTIGDSPFICIERPCVQDGHLTATFAVVPRILSRSAIVAHFFVRHLGCDYLVSSNSVDISKSRIRGPMPLIEIDTNIATSTLPRNGEISLDAVRVEVGLLDVAVADTSWRSYRVGQTTISATDEPWTDCRPCIESPDLSISFKLLCGPRVCPDGLFRMKLIQLTPKYLTVVQNLGPSEATVTVNATPIRICALHRSDVISRIFGPVGAWAAEPAA
jgi:hypothetical protein